MAERPRLLFVGPHLGCHPGWVTTQGEILAGLFAGVGYQVRSTSSILHPAGRLVDTLRSLWRWRREVDVVVLSVFSGRGFLIADLASRAAKRLGLPQVHVLRGGGFPEFVHRHPRWADRFLGRADFLVAPSFFLAEVVKKLGHPAGVIPNVLDLARYPPRLLKEARPRLLWVRTFHEIYRPAMAIEVLQALVESGVDATLTMAGQDKGLLGKVRGMAAERGLTGRLRFPGFLDMDAKRREFASHDVFLNTNRVDNTPVTVLEAGACGLPIIATKVGGIPYLLRHEETALLVEDGDAAAMAAAVRRLLAEKALTETLSREGRKLAESCAWPRVLESWERLFEGLRGTWTSSSG